MARRQHIEEQLNKDYELLKQLEDRLRYEDDPLRKGRFSADIEEIKQRISERETELKSLEKGSESPVAQLQTQSVPHPQTEAAPQSPAMTPQPEPTLGSENQAIEVFFSYAHEDEELRDELAKHLKLLERQKVISAWYDRDISAGDDWKQEIEQRLNSADVILLLISADFLASDFCWGVELKRAMERHETGGARVIPIILREVDWKGAPFGKLQALPKNAEPVTNWANRDQAFADIARGIRKAVSELKQQGKLDADLGGVHLEIPEGQVPLDSPFYVERPPIEADCYETIVQPGALIRVKAARQMGKSSLMTRILHHAAQADYRTASYDFQLVDDDESLTSLDQFLQWFCASISDELNFPDKLTDLWKAVLGSPKNCTNYFQRYLLSELETPLTLGLDEVDRVFRHPEIATGFFGLLRAWHEKGKNDTIWQKLRLVIVHSKEVYIPLDINQSPFNVGFSVELPQLTPSQVEGLARRHGLGWSVEQVKPLMAMCGGHPYLIRVALYEIARGRMSLAQLLQVAPTEEGMYQEHLRRHLLNLEQEPDLLTALKQVVAAPCPVQIDSTEAFKLKSMGLVKFQGNKVMPLCELYRQYFRNRLGIS